MLEELAAKVRDQVIGRLRRWVVRRVGERHAGLVDCGGLCSVACGTGTPLVALQPAASG